MRLIDADALEQLIDVKGANLGITNANRCNFKDMLKMVPTVDAVEVVRCRDCKYQKTEPCVGGTYQACIHKDHEGVDGCCPNIISQDWFCADGERKEND